MTLWYVENKEWHFFLVCVNRVMLRLGFEWCLWACLKHEREYLLLIFFFFFLLFLPKVGDSFLSQVRSEIVALLLHIKEITLTAARKHTKQREGRQFLCFFALLSDPCDMVCLKQAADTRYAYAQIELAKKYSMIPTERKRNTGSWDALGFPKRPWRCCAMLSVGHCCLSFSLLSCAIGRSLLFFLSCCALGRSMLSFFLSCTVLLVTCCCLSSSLLCSALGRSLLSFSDAVLSVARCCLSLAVCCLPLAVLFFLSLALCCRSPAVVFLSLFLALCYQSIAAFFLSLALCCHLLALSLSHAVLSVACCCLTFSLLLALCCRSVADRFVSRCAIGRSLLSCTHAVLSVARCCLSFSLSWAVLLVACLSLSSLFLAPVKDDFFLVSKSMSEWLIHH